MSAKRRPNDKTLDKCEIHEKVLAYCIDDLTKSAAFNKEKVLVALKLEGVANAIYWDYIRRRIETGGIADEQGHKVKVSLLPVSTAVFKRKRTPHMSLNHMLAGPGGKCAGYALASINGGQIALASVGLRVSQVNGAAKATRDRAEIMADTLDSKIATSIRSVAGIAPPIASN